MNRRDFLVTAGASATALAQEPGTEDLLLRTGTMQVMAPTTVMQKSSGEYVNGLLPGDFELYDNDRLQKVDVDVSYIPISLVVAVQKSAQTTEMLPKIMRIANMLEGVITGDQGQIAVLGFDHRIDLMQEFTNESEKLKTALTKLRPGSNSSRMNDAVMEASRMLVRNDRENKRRKIILLIGETQDRGSEIKLKYVLRALELNNIIVYPVNMSRWLNKLGEKTPVPRPDPFPVHSRPMPPGAAVTPTTVAQNTGFMFGNYTVLIKELFTATKAVFVSNPQEVFAKYTGGREHDFVSQRGLEEAVQKIGEELHSQYLLTYRPTDKTKEDGGWHKIQVVVKRPGLEVRTRAGYWAAAKFENTGNP
jgi:VWFA-related protein